MTLEIKTTDDIGFAQPRDKKWVSVESLFDMDIYRFICKKIGKAEVWKSNPDELLERLEQELRKMVNNDD